MREFFKSWRRKAGVVALGLACVFMAGWVRSVGFQDRRATMITPKCAGMFFSGESCLAFSLAWVADDDSDIAWAKSLMLFKFSLDMYFTIVDSHQARLGSWPTGFGLFRKDISGVQHAGFLIPYWSIVFPLTLLSAWLILSTPRPAKPTQSIDPDHA